MTITIRLVDRFHDSGSVVKKRSGKPYVFTNENVEGMKQMSLQLPFKSSGKLDRPAHMSYSVAQRASKHMVSL
jgi:hypothetical protein